jgi:hypothetical protein
MIERRALARLPRQLDIAQREATLPAQVLEHYGTDLSAPQTAKCQPAPALHIAAQQRQR